MARWNGSIRARGFCPGRSISIVEAELTTIAIHCLRGGSLACNLTYRNSARYWPASAIGASSLDLRRNVAPIYWRTTGGFVGQGDDGACTGAAVMGGGGGGAAVVLGR